MQNNYLTKISRRMQSVQSPIVPTVADLIKATPDTISLGQGIVYYGPPAAALKNALRHEKDLNQVYGPVEGKPELIDKIKAKLIAENSLSVNDDRCIIVTAGANMGFLNAMFAIADPSDEIILPAPYYFNHEMAVRMLNCKPVCVATDKNFQIDPDEIASAITNRTAAVVTISPNNPSGAMYSEKSLREVNRLCREHGIYHISDEAYEYFVFDERRHFSPAGLDDSNRHTISLFSLSKAYGFSSWRIGYMLAPPQLRETMKKIQDTNLICPPAASQYAAIGALEAGRAYCDEKIKLIADNRKLVLNELKKLNCRINGINADGAFYVFLRLDTGRADMEVVKQLICDFKIAVMPGSAFGMVDACYIRVAYGALDKSTIEDGMQRLIDGLNSIIR